jgi:hydrogenase maturation protease
MRHRLKDEADSSGRVLIGGVGYRWQRDGSFGLVVCDRLAEMDLPVGVEAADLGYGAIYAAQDIAYAEPPYTRLILIGGVERERERGRLYPRRIEKIEVGPDEMQARMAEAGGGVIDMDHLLAIAQYFNALPADVLVLELEPVDTRGGDVLSPPAAALLPVALEWALREAAAPRKVLESQEE